MALIGAAGVSLSPLMGYNFYVTLLDTSSELAAVASIASAVAFDAVLGGFTEVQGLELSMDIEEIREGGRNSEMLVFPKGAKWSRLVLKKGVGAGTALWDWSYSFVEGKGKRRDGVIVLLNDLHLPNNIWYFRRGLPVKYTGPAMNATANAAAIESIEIAHEGIYQVPGIGYGAAVASGAVGLSV